MFFIFILAALSVAQPMSNFTITLINLANTTIYNAVVRSAADRWSQIIVGDLPDVPAGTRNLLARYGNYTGAVDDVLIGYDFSRIDGQGGVLGGSGPLYIRPGTNLPISGFVKLDSDDMAGMQKEGTLFSVLLHEMGHALGLGTLWTRAGLMNCSAPFTGTRYTGRFAQEAFANLTGSARVLNVEDVGPSGTRCVHWPKKDFLNEIMTGYALKVMPVSIVTVGSLQDLGYVVNYNAADKYTLP
jgi:hypothetical protein